jgi:GT2 family glycosyltransferase
VAIPELTIIIPSLNGLHVLKTCLQSIYDQTYSAFEVILVDNGSRDGSAEWVECHYPKIKIVRFTDNKGFSAAVNEGIRQSSGRYIFLLNNDTELESRCLEILIQTADDNGTYASFAPKMIRYSNRNTLDGLGDGVLRGGGGYRIGNQEPDGVLWEQPTHVFGACAGAALYRRSFFEEAGMFDEKFFAYLEDVDINFRAVRLGLQCMTVPGARVYHMGSQTSGGRLTPFTVSRTTQNMIRVVVHNYPLSILMRQWPIIVLHHLGWLSLMLLSREFSAYLKGIRSALLDFPEMLKKRVQWHIRKTISDSLFWKLVTDSEFDVMTCVLRRRGLQKKSERWIRLYLKVFHPDAINKKVG